MTRFHSILLAVLVCVPGLQAEDTKTRLARPPELLNHVVKTLGGEPRHMAAYHGQPLLVVNVASKCGLTPQYEGLQALYDAYGPKGLKIAAFPCNDFRGQEPGSAEEIATFCSARYGVTFDLMEKITVAKEDRHPFYAQLITAAGGPDAIRWNFEKFLLNRDGSVAARFAPKTKPNDPAVIAAIQAALDAPAPDPLGYTYYLGRRVAHTMHWKAANWLTRTEREREEATSVMLKELRLKPGMIVADVGCGNGYHALPMARSVSPGGKIIGSDIQPEMLKFLKKRAKADAITNIVTVSGSLTDPGLPNDVVDRILLVDAYHEFSHPPQMLAAMRRALKPDGQIILVEFRSEDPDVPIKPDHKMSRKQVIKELSANGFSLVRSFDDLPWQHMLFFERAE